MIEKSGAVKCPNIAYQLVGAKKVQQVLAEPGVLERFVGTSILFMGIFIFHGRTAPSLKLKMIFIAKRFYFSYKMFFFLTFSLKLFLSFSLKKF